MSTLSTRENSPEEDRTLSYGTLSEKDRNSSSGGLSNIFECREDAIHSSQSEESSPNGDSRRPTLAPPETAPAANLLQPTARNGHHQSQSTGEYSFMSAITETSFGEGDPAKKQIPSKTSSKRTVSWDQNLFDSAHVTSVVPATILQPTLQHELSPLTKGDSPRHRRRTSTLDLANFKNRNPMETEAETAIREALEEESHLEQMTSRTDSASTFMPQVSDKSLNLSVSISMKSIIPTSTETHSPQTLNQTKKLNLADLKKGNPMETEAETSIIAVIEQESRIEEKSGRADSASILMPHIPDEGLDIFDSNSTKSKIPGLRRSASPDSTKSVESLKASLSSSAEKTHRRKKSIMPPEGLTMDQSETLESTLTGLADTMRMIHIESTENADPKELKRNHRRLPSRDIGHPAATMESIPINNADVLVHNANLLLRRNIPREDLSQNAVLSQSEPPQEQKPVWKIFDTKPDPKKTDGDHLDHLEDVQEGSSNESVCSNPLDTDRLSEDVEEGKRDSREDDASRLATVGTPGKTKISNKARRIFERTKQRILKGWDLFVAFLWPKQVYIALYCRVVFLYLLPPIAGVAAILFYTVDNPIMTANGASISWLLLFFARQIVTFTLSNATSLLVIDFLFLRTRWSVRVFGSTVALFVVQSKGFPFLISTWSIYNFMFLSGKHQIANHWLFWQDLIAMCNKNNPSGGIPSSSMNYRILGSVLSVGILVSIKRVWVGLYLGRRSFGKCHQSYFVFFTSALGFYLSPPRLELL